MPLSLLHRTGPALVLAITASHTLPAAAQVVRCTDPATGKITYTDGDCRRGEAVREVEARKSPQEIAQEREQAAEALQHKHERQQLEAQQRRAAQQAEQASRSAQPSAVYDPAQSLECQRARKNLQDLLPTLGQGLYDEQTRLDAAQRQADLACLSPAEYARTERSRGYRSIYTSPYYTRPTVVVPPRPMPAPPQREIANCNVFRCYDGKGNTYPR